MGCMLWTMDRIHTQKGKWKKYQIPLRPSATLTPLTTAWIVEIFE